MKRLAVVAIAFGMLGSGGGVAAAFNGSPVGMEVEDRDSDRKGHHGKKCSHDRGDHDRCRGGHGHGHGGGLIDIDIL